MQPESSIDYLAPHYRDQIKLILQIASKLPANYKLVVKDHPGEIHCFNLIQKIKLLFSSDIYWMRTDINILENIKLFETVIGVTGTLSGQFALYGKLGFTLVPIFFNEHELCNYIDLDQIDQIDKVIADKSFINVDLENDRFLGSVKSNTFPGYIFKTPEYGYKDPRSVKAFKSFVTHYFYG